MIVSVNTQDIQIGKRHRLGRDIESLAESIQRLGLLNPITITEDHVLVAGYRRLCACKLLEWAEVPCNVLALGNLDAELAEIDENLMRDDLTVLERSEHLARRKEIYEALHPEVRAGIAGGKARQGSATEMISFATDTAAKAGVSERTIQHEVQIATDLTEEVRDMIRDTPLADVKTDLIHLARMEPEQQTKVAEMIVSGEAKSVMDARRLVRREDMKTAPIPEGKYRVFYADPPWQYNDSGVINGDNYGRAERHYPTMSIDELCAIPVADMAADNAVLFLWVTSPLLEDAFQIIRAWSFSYKTSFIWDKVRHNVGHYNSVRHEFLLICTRGSCLPNSPKLLDSVVEIERSDKHSEKPEAFREIIDSMYPHGDRIELFARGQVPDGWASWGNE